jgi:hypothetical protein
MKKVLRVLVIVSLIRSYPPKQHVKDGKGKYIINIQFNYE